MTVRAGLDPGAWCVVPGRGPGSCVLLLAPASCGPGPGLLLLRPGEWCPAESGPQEEWCGVDVSVVTVYVPTDVR